MKSIEEVLRLIPLGITNPFFCRIGGINHVAKWQHCDEMHYPLVNEHVGYEICKRFGLNLPAHDFVTITKEAVTQNKTGLNFSTNDIFFVTQQIPKVFILNSGEQLRTADPIKFIEMMFIDVILCNTDRNEGNILLQKPAGENVIIYPIDYSHAFYKGCLWSEGQFQQLIDDPSCLKDLNQYFHHVGYQLIFSSFRFTENQIMQVSNDLKIKADRIDLDDVFASLPQQLRELCTDTDLKLFQNFISTRLSQIDAICYEILDYLNLKKLPQSNPY